MKVMLITPTYLPETTGNAVTAHRLYSGLTGKGVDCRVISGIDAQAPSGFRPDVIHALHALKGGLVAMKMAEELSIPYIVTITGTDINIDLTEGDGRVVDVLNGSSAVIVYSELTGVRLRERLPCLGDKIRVIRPSVSIVSGIEAKMPRKGNRFRFLLPAGIRRVKDPSFAVRPLEELREEFPGLELVVVGPILNDEEWERFSGEITGRDWVSYRCVRHEEMASEYLSSDVVLNTSVSEGLSNAVLEGMSLGLPVLASDCEGNRSVITDGVDGILYRQGDTEDFKARAGTLMRDAGLRRSIGEAAREKARRDHSVEAEIERHIGLYKEVVEKC